MTQGFPRVMAGILILLILLPALSSAKTVEGVPPELERWRTWVLHGYESGLCPDRFNDSSVSRCQWPSMLKLDISDDGARFEQRWAVFAPGWVALPGDPAVWPDGVSLDGDPVAVVERRQTPSIWVSIGEHRVQGRFFWRQIPKTISLPPSLGMLTLSRNGLPLSITGLINQDKLWLAQERLIETPGNVAAVKIFRLLRDTVPMQVTTVFRLDISGESRELVLNGALPAGAMAMGLISPLPARLDDENSLVLQARPGHWEIQVKARLTGPQSRIEAGPLPYGPEIWSFEAQHQLRLVEIQNAVSVEPSQTGVPEPWRGFAAYAVSPDDTLILKEIRRGDPDPPPDQLTLERIWWLDFDGRGYTISDRMSGSIRRQWHLAVNAPVALGRVSVNGQNQVISAQGPEKKPGVQLRTGQVDLQADSRMPKTTGRLQTVGWDHDFEHVSGRLCLPPGWRLLGTKGIDRVSHTWLQDWSLLDFFLVLIICLAVFKLRDLKWALVALLLLILIFQEPGAPRLVWLHLLAVSALLPRLPSGWIRRCIMLWGVGALVLLLVQALPFAVNQIRWGIFPQLAFLQVQPLDLQQRGDRLAKTVTDTGQETLTESRPPASAERERDIKILQSSAAPPKPAAVAAPPAAREPDALIPTGPGLPQWHWQTIHLSWSGPVARHQTMGLYLLSPRINLILAVLRVALLLLFIVGFIQWRPWWHAVASRFNTAGFLLLLLLIIRPAAFVQAQQTAGDFPPPQLLEELRQRLLEKSDCYPACADIARMEISLSGDQMQIMLKVHAAVRTALPLPVNSETWTPDQVLLNNAPLGGLAREKGGQLWAVVPAGVHTIMIAGHTDPADMLQLPLVLKPHAVSITGPQWEVRGIAPDGSLADTIQLVRLGTDGAAAQSRQAAHIPPFFQVERRLDLGLIWQVTTVVKRLTALGSPVVVHIPLLAGESVTTPGIQVEQGRAMIQMTPDQQTRSYSATLPVTSSIELTAPRSMTWVETWQLNAAEIWDCRIQGIAPIHHLNSAGLWQPQWQPWPDESITIHISRPQAIEGQTRTIDRVELAMTPGRRFATGDLILDMRASQGGQHTVTLPENAHLQSVSLNGETLPVRQEDRLVVLPIRPGQQRIHIQWREASAFSPFFKTPVVNAGQEAINARLTVNMPDSRWVLLTSGPLWGPAVLFWSHLVVLLFIAFGLGRITLTPLKTWQWLLLALGMTQIPAGMALVVAGWLIALGIRRRSDMPDHWLAFNSIQIGLVLLSLGAMICLFFAVKSGLIGQPQMHISGNGSSHLALHWTQDRVSGMLPQARIFSLSVWVYHGLMLIWSLWLALSLIAWLKWGWRGFSLGGLWRKIQPLRKGRSSTAAQGGTRVAP